MKYLVNSIIILVVSMSLLACDDKDKAVPQVQEEVYNFRDEKYQDFYSRFMREVERRNDGSINANDSFDKSFDNKFIKESLGIEHQGDILFKLGIERSSIENMQDYLIGNNLATKSQVLDLHKDNNNLFNKVHDFKECNKSSAYEIDGLTCFIGKKEDILMYYYLNNSTVKIREVNHSFNFYCYLSKNGDADCKLSKFQINPYNIDVRISFSNPNDFFHIIEYVEKYIHNATGEHIWQTSLNKN